MSKKLFVALLAACSTVSYFVGRVVEGLFVEIENTDWTRDW